MHQIISDETMESYRTIGDNEADKFISDFTKKHGAKQLRDIMPYLSDYKHTINIEQTYPEVLEFIHEHTNLPDFFDKKEIIRACEFYEKYTFQIGMILSLYALPYCYLGAKGAEVLVMTTRIKNDTYKRLLETGAFLQSILILDNWKNGKATLTLGKVRLLHACVRAFIQHSNKWNLENGTPVNQEDLAGTNLAFSLIVLRGLRKIGIVFDHHFEKAYFHLWKVAGTLLGVKPELLAENIKEAMAIDKLIAQRQFKPSGAGKELAHALMKCFEDLTNNKIEFEMIAGQARLMLGEDYANMLQIPKTKVPLQLLKTYNYSSSFLKNMYN